MSGPLALEVAQWQGSGAARVLRRIVNGLYGSSPH